jgi:hypothetical protein
MVSGLDNTVNGTSRKLFGKKVTPEDACPYPMTAPSVSRSGEQLK